MKTRKRDSVYSLLTMLALILSGLAGYFSYRAQHFLRKIESDQAPRIETLEIDIRRIEDRIQSITRRTASLGEQSAADFGRQEAIGGGAGFENTPDSAIALSPNELRRLSRLLESTSRSQRRLEQIVESTGLEQLAALKNVDPDVLKEIYNEHTTQKEIKSQRTYLMEKNSELHQADGLLYGEDLAALYQRARSRGGGASGREERERALLEMLDRYPDAYATGMVIAERGLFSAIRSQTAEAEKYYTLLRENENFSQIVTDRGTEAMPNIEYYLARQYIRQGRPGEARLLIESLEKNHPETLLLVRRRGQGLSWRKVSEEMAELRKSLNR